MSNQLYVVSLCCMALIKIKWSNQVWKSDLSKNDHWTGKKENLCNANIVIEWCDKNKNFQMKKKIESTKKKRSKVYSKEMYLNHIIKMP